MAHKELLVRWLHDAHAMEKALVPILKNHARDARDHHDVMDHLQAHLHETERHAMLLEQCLRRLNEQPSTAKTGIAKLFGAMQAPATGMYEDELVKNNIVDFATENFEIACYLALIAAAEELGETEIAFTCREILQEEQEMAEWLQAQLPNTVRGHMAQHVTT